MDHHHRAGLPDLHRGVALAELHVTMNREDGRSAVGGTARVHNQLTVLYPHPPANATRSDGASYYSTTEEADPDPSPAPTATVPTNPAADRRASAQVDAALRPQRRTNGVVDLSGTAQTVPVSSARRRARINWLSEGLQIVMTTFPRACPSTT